MVWKREKCKIFCSNDSIYYILYMCIQSDEKVVVDQDEKALNSSEYEDFEESYSDADSEKHSKEDSTNPKKKNQPSFNTKHFRKKKLKMKRAQRDSNCPILVAQTGMRVVTETITTKSEV